LQPNDKSKPLTQKSRNATTNQKILQHK